jgi:hypothetical protein
VKSDDAIEPTDRAELDFFIPLSGGASDRDSDSVKDLDELDLFTPRLFKGESSKFNAALIAGSFNSSRLPVLSGSTIVGLGASRIFSRVCSNRFDCFKLVYMYISSFINVRVASL